MRGLTASRRRCCRRASSDAPVDRMGHGPLESDADGRGRASPRRRGRRTVCWLHALVDGGSPCRAPYLTDADLHPAIRAARGRLPRAGGSPRWWLPRRLSGGHRRHGAEPVSAARPPALDAAGVRPPRPGLRQLLQWLAAPHALKMSDRLADLSDGLRQRPPGRRRGRPDAADGQRRAAATAGVTAAAPRRGGSASPARIPGSARACGRAADGGRGAADGLAAVRRTATQPDACRPLPPGRAGWTACATRRCAAACSVRSTRRGPTARRSRSTTW